MSKKLGIVALEFKSKLSDFIINTFNPLYKEFKRIERRKAGREEVRKIKEEKIVSVGASLVVSSLRIYLAI